MWLQEQAPKSVLYTGTDVALGDAPEPRIHNQRFPACHVVQQGIKLGAIADPLPHLGMTAREAAGQREAPLDFSQLICPGWSISPCTGLMSKLDKEHFSKGTGEACLAQGAHRQPHCPITGQRWARVSSTMGSVAAG